MSSGPVRPQMNNSTGAEGKFESVVNEKDVVEPEEVLVGEQEDAGDAGRDEDLFGGEPEGEAEGTVEDLDEDFNSIPCNAEAQAEFAPLRISPDPGRPTQSEIDEHDIDHLPYRSWCEDCVRARGTGEQHRTGESGCIPIIAFD